MITNKLYEHIEQLEARILVLESLLRGVKTFDTNIKIDGEPFPVSLFIVDKTGKIHPPKPVFSIVTPEVSQGQ